MRKDIPEISFTSPPVVAPQVINRPLSPARLGRYPTLRTDMPMTTSTPAPFSQQLHTFSHLLLCVVEDRIGPQDHGFGICGRTRRSSSHEPRRVRHLTAIIPTPLPAPMINTVFAMLEPCQGKQHVRGGHDTSGNAAPAQTRGFLESAAHAERHFHILRIAAVRPWRRLVLGAAQISRPPDTVAFQQLIPGKRHTLPNRGH